jgi:hypothetical protein
MSDSEGLPKENQVESTSSEERFSRLNWILLIVGIVMLFGGFLTLTQVNPEADNLAGILAPILIIGSYLTIFISLIVRD